MGAVVFVGLMVLALGVITYATDVDVFPSGAGNVPGILAGAVAAITWIAVLTPRLRQAGLGTAVIAGFAAAIAYTLMAVLAVVGNGFAYAGSVATHLLTGWFALGIVAAGILAATLTIVIARAGGGATERARWPWERDDPDEQ